MVSFVDAHRHTAVLSHQRRIAEYLPAKYPRTNAAATPGHPRNNPSRNPAVIVAPNNIQPCGVNITNAPLGHNLLML
jgi:hypothetical protein